MRTVFTNLLVREDSLKGVFENLFPTHFLLERDVFINVIISLKLIKALMWMVCCVCVCVFYLEMFIKLVHQACEELICILLFPHIQLLVPHLEDLE